jgi:putative nucleotidyltransferase with HDIG domain
MSATAMVAVEDLRVGMFVHLDVGWMSHPFPLSSFKISSMEQIEVIRGLGMKQLRWSPERSDPERARASRPTRHRPSRPRRPSGRWTGRGGPPGRGRLDRAPAGRAAVCERQYMEACRDLRKITDRLGAEPQQAREAAEQLSRAMLDKMLVEGDLCVRLLGEPLSDRATAHAMNVTVVSLLLARSLQMAEADLLDLGTGALLHDIGKLALPERVRLPREDFSTAEHALYRDHVAQGVVQGQRMGLKPAALLVLAQHHEFADGTGFPRASKLESQSVLARVVAMVNLYDNLCNAAMPSQSLTPHEALSRMFAQSRNKFDVTILSGFIRLMGIYPPGSVVQLSDDRYATVMSINAARPLKPRVQVYDPSRSSSRALHLDLEQTPDLGIRRSLRADQLPAAAAECLAPRLRVAYFFDVEPVTAPADAPALV